MKPRRLAVTLEIYATKTHCGECSFQHSEWSGCILFGEALRRDPGPGIKNRRLEQCAKTEWMTRKEEPAK